MCAGSAYGRGMELSAVDGLADVSAVLKNVRRVGYPLQTAFGVSVDFKEGMGTGISAAGRTATIRALADPMTGPADLSRPLRHQC